MWLLSILLLLLTLLPSMAMNNTTDIDDFMRLTIKFQYANCSNHSSSSDIYNVSDLIAYHENQNQNADTDSFFTDAKSVKKLTLNSTFINRRGQKCGQENDGIRLCEYNYKISGKNEVDDRIRKFAFRLLTPLSLQDDYTCCWSFDSAQIDRNINGTIKKDILPFNNSNVYAKQPPTCVHSNLTWICPRTSNKIVFESGVFIGNFSSHSVTYINPENCTNDADQFQQTDDLTCVFPTNNESTAYLFPTNNEPVSKMCVSEGAWDSVSADTNVTMSTGVRECYNGTVEAVRFCSSNGSWGDVQCLVSSTFNYTLNQIITAPVEGLQRLSEAIDFIPLSQSVVLLDKALEIALELSDDIDKKKFAENFLNISSSIISSLIIEGMIDEPDDDETDSQSRRVVSQLLQSLDTIALTLIDPSEDVLEFSGSLLKVTQVEARSTMDSNIVGIKVSSNSITLPDTIFKDTATPIRIGSFLFPPDLSLLLPPLDTNSSIISPIISSTINCKSCPVTDLTKPVLMTLQIENSLDLSSNGEMYISCVFYDFKNQDGLLPSGDWNSSGCTTEVNGDLVTCSCNHLTHFAILLSPGGEISPIHYDVLNTIGLVLVPISLLCMVLVILTYTLIRSLWSIRNYIHVMLCASLFMAQLVFIIGVDKIENQGACSAVGVILLYLFLVTFMWMLMEGVVLYVTLVRVFIQNHKYYIIAFTVASYVIPALYMALVVPIGFLVTENTGSFLYYTESKAVNHPHLTACWLNYSTGFIWSFIAPVIVIIMANIGFFIMSIVIMMKHMKRQKNKFNAKTRHWLKVSISLTLVMGIAWLVGVLAFRRELLPVAYIITVFIAGQGILIFIILVPMSKQVREAYIKLWHTKTSQSTLLSKVADYFAISSNNMSLTGIAGGKRDNNQRKRGGPCGGGIILGTFETAEINDSVRSPKSPHFCNSINGTATDNNTVNGSLQHHSQDGVRNPRFEPTAAADYENVIETVSTTIP